VKPVGVAGTWSSPWFSASANHEGEIVKRVETFFGKDIYNIDKGISRQIPIDLSIFKDGHEGFTKDLIDEETESVDVMLSHITDVLIVANPAAGAQWNRGTRSLTKGLTPEEIEEHKAYALRSRTYSIFIGIDFDPKTVAYVTQSEHYDPVVLWQYASTNVRAVNDTNIDCANPPQLIRQQVGQMGNKRRPNFNDEGVAIDYAGAPVVIPQVDAIDSYYDTARELGTDDDVMGFSMVHPLTSYADQKQIDEEGNVANRVLFHDPIHNVLLYVANHQLKNRMLDKSVKAEAHHLDDIMASRVDSSAPNSALKMGFQNLVYYIKEYPDLLDKVKIDPSDFNILFDADQQRTITRFENVYYSPSNSQEMVGSIRQVLKNPVRYLDAAVNALRAIQNHYDVLIQTKEDYEIPKAIRWVVDLDMDKLGIKDIKPDSDVTLLRPLGAYMKALSKAVLDDPIKHMEMRDVSNGMEAMGMAHMLTTYMDDLKDINKQAKKFYAKNNLDKPTNDWEAPGLPGGKEG
jgi:hypothetical protein